MCVWGVEGAACCTIYLVCVIVHGGRVGLGGAIGARGAAFQIMGGGGGLATPLPPPPPPQAYAGSRAASECSSWGDGAGRGRGLHKGLHIDNVRVARGG